MEVANQEGGCKNSSQVEAEKEQHKMQFSTTPSVPDEIERLRKTMQCSSCHGTQPRRNGKENDKHEQRRE